MRFGFELQSTNAPEGTGCVSHAIGMLARDAIMLSVSGEQQADDSETNRPEAPQHRHVLGELWGWMTIFATSHVMWELEDIESRGKPASSTWRPKPGGVQGALRTAALCVALIASTLLLTWLVALLMPAHARWLFVMFFGGGMTSVILCVLVPPIIHDLRGLRSSTSGATKDTGDIEKGPTSGAPPS